MVAYRSVADASILVGVVLHVRVDSLQVLSHLSVFKGQSAFVRDAIRNSKYSVGYQGISHLGHLEPRPVALRNAAAGPSVW